MIPFKQPVSAFKYRKWIGFKKSINSLWKRGWEEKKVYKFLMAWLSEFNRLEWDSDEELMVCRYCEVFSMHLTSSLAKVCDNFKHQMLTKHLESKTHINCKDWCLEIWKICAGCSLRLVSMTMYKWLWNLPQGQGFNFRSLWSNLTRYQLTVALISHVFVLCSHVSLMNCSPNHNETKDRYYELIRQKQWLVLSRRKIILWSRKFYK